jgi:tetratricopeptide (TPR) repeat protein
VRNPLARLIQVAMLVSACAMSTAAAGRPWRAIRGRNVVVFGQQSAGTLRAIAVEIEQFRLVLGNLIQGARQPQPLPTEVYVFDDASALRPFVPLYQGKPAVLGGFCHCGSTDDLSFVVAGLSQYAASSAIIYHEYTHLLLRNAISDVPVWLNEGLAEYYSTFNLFGHDRQAEIGMPIPRHVQTLREQMLPVAQLLAVDRSSALYNEGNRRSIFYAEAWALTHYLLTERRDGAAIVNKYVSAVAGGTPSDIALTQTAGISIKDLDTELRQYINRPSFKSLRYTLSDRVEVDEPEHARELPPAEAEARLGDIQLRVGRIKEAAPRIEAAAKHGPEVGQAQLVLSFLRLRQGRYEDAFPLLERAASQSQNDFAAQYMYGLALLRRDAGMDDVKETPVERARLARAALGRAAALHPQSAAALAWLAFADMVVNDNLAEARDATRRAIALAPGRLDYALQLAEIDLRLGHPDEGRRLLTDLAKSPDEEVADRAKSLLDRMDARERLARADVRLPGESPVASGSADRQLEFRFRTLRGGEARAYGDLVDVACTSSGVRFRVRAGDRDVVATAKRIEDVELIAYGNGQALAITCGIQNPPRKVYLTWTKEFATDALAAVAVEFLPEDFVP